MSSHSLSADIRQVFGLAARRHAAAKLLNGEEWARYRKIQEDYAAQAQFEQRCFELEYKSRFEIARKRIIDKLAARERTLTPRWHGRDRFDKSAIDRQADREVRHSHQALLDHLEVKKGEAIDAVLKDCEHRQQLREKPMRDFARAAERRSGRHRRKGPSR